MTKAVILQSNYLPWKGYFDLIDEADVFIYYDEVQYTKNDWRNRNRIYARDGLQWLTIPIGREAVRGAISAVEISNNSWQEKHFKQLYHGYRRAPYFGQLEPLLNEVYHEKQWRRLVDVNRYLIGKISDMLGIRSQFLDSVNFDLPGERVEKLVHLLTRIGASVYLSGPSAQDYLSGHEHLFAKQDIQLVFKDYSDYPEYPQLCSPFVHQVSILDMIANLKLEKIRYYLCDFRKTG